MILIQHNHVQDEIAGVLTYINSIAPEFHKRGIETQVISTKETSVRDWLTAIAQADVVHMNSNHLAFAILCKLLGKKIILKYHYLFYLSIHDHYEPMSLLQRLKTEFIYSLPKRNYPLKWKLHTFIKLARLITRFSTTLVSDRQAACSQFLAESHSFPWKVHTLYNPINIPRNQPEKTIDTFSKPYSFVYVGRLYNDKGVDLLLKATKILRTQNHPFKVLIIGDGNQAKDLKDLADKLEISDCVKFLGNYSQPDILPIVRSSLALIAPSRWQEPAGYVTLEASSVQTCSIVANVGGLPEMAGTNNLLFEAENIQELAAAMQGCLENPQAAIDRGKSAYQYVSERFSPVSVVDQFLMIYQEIGQAAIIQDSKT
ncbi:glycosyltransferase family 4 protein [Phormidesmis sp. 146-33]